MKEVLQEEWDRITIGEISGLSLVGGNGWEAGSGWMVRFGIWEMEWGWISLLIFVVVNFFIRHWIPLLLSFILSPFSSELGKYWCRRMDFCQEHPASG